jgi:hypothetical protein
VQVLGMTCETYKPLRPEISRPFSLALEKVGAHGKSWPKVKWSLPSSSATFLNQSLGSGACFPKKAKKPCLNP